MPVGTVARIAAHSLMDANPFPTPFFIGIIYVIIIAYQKNDWKPFPGSFFKIICSSLSVRPGFRGLRSVLSA